MNKLAALLLLALALPAAALTQTRYSQIKGAPINVGDYCLDPAATTDCTSKIQQALTLGAGKEVRFPDGASYLFSGPLTVASGTKVTGRARLVASSIGTVSAAFNLTGVTGATVSDVEIDGQTNAGGTVGLAFGVIITGGANNTVSGIYVHDTFSEGIKTDGGSGHIIQGNRCVSNGRASSLEDQGISIDAATANSSNIVVSGNYVSGAHRKGIAVYAAIGFTLSDVSLVGNTIVSAGLGGIFVACQPGAPVLRNVTVAGNTISNSYTGLEVDYTTGASVTGNVVRGCSHFGGAFDYLVSSAVVGNTFDQSGAYGVQITSNSGQTTDLNFSSNVISYSNTSAGGFGPGLNITDTKYSTFAHNHVIDRGGTPKQTDGIVEAGTSDYNQFLDNVVIGASAPSHLYGVNPNGHSVLRQMGSSQAVTSFGTNISTNTAPWTLTEKLTFEGQVVLAGDLISTSGTVAAGSTLATLDAAYRPNRSINLPIVTSNGTSTYIQISSAGVVTCGRAIVQSGEYARLDAVSYRLTN